MMCGVVWNLHYANPVVCDAGDRRISGSTAIGGVKR
jgi:hypothetical protein